VRLRRSTICFTQRNSSDTASSLVSPITCVTSKSQPYSNSVFKIFKLHTIYRKQFQLKYKVFFK
ncbi:hypothetical protein, partial [Clostridium sp.]|uniref:hypothetical protein n=1 Tax=Clostridium sp. TaxID=1506 RepID=UPI002FDD3022